MTHTPVFEPFINSPTPHYNLLAGNDTLLLPTGLVLASLSTNIAANIVAPANAIVNLSPDRLTFRAAALISCALGAAVLPWKLIASTQVGPSHFNKMLTGER